jgi:hypothetical protein
VPSAAAEAAAASAAQLLAGMDKAKLQQLAKRLQRQQRKAQKQTAVHFGSCGISRVSSDMTQMLALSVSASSEDCEGRADDGSSTEGDSER